MEKTKLTRLTDTERKFAEDNLSLVYSWLHLHHYDVDQYYDIAVFGYLRSVQIWHSRPELHKYAFSTIAYMYMKSELSLNHSIAKAKKRTVPGVMVYLDHPSIYDDSDSRDMSETIADETVNIESEVMETETLDWMIKKIESNLSPSDYQYLRAIIKYNGFMPDIAREFGVSVQRVHQRVKRIRIATACALQL